jgi:hypothetical protein
MSFALIYNLAATAQWHKEHCAENCDVSLFLLKQAAIHLNTMLSLEEYKEAEQIISKMPVI